MKTYTKAMRVRLHAMLRAVRATGQPIRNELEPLFICGAMGSGTTLITRLIDQHFHTAGVANETALQIPRSSPLYLKRSYRFRSLDEMSRAMFLSPDVDPVTVRVDLLDYYRRVQRSTGEDASEVVVVDKAPNAHLVRTPGLRAAFPRGKFLFIFRNPLSAVEGLTRKWEICAKAPFEHVARFWVLMHESFERDTAFFRQSVIPVPYEVLTADPDRVLAALEKHVPLRKRTEPKGYGNRPNKEGFGLRNVSDGQIKVVKGVSEASKNRLPDDLKAIVDEVAMPTYERLLRNFDLPSVSD